MIKSVLLPAMCLAVSAVTFATPSLAESRSSTIDLATFKGRCSAYGGEAIPRDGGIVCILDDGVVVQCYPNGSDGINCDVIRTEARAPIVRRILGPIKGETRSRNGQGGQGNGGGSGQASGQNQGNTNGSSGGMISGTVSGGGPTKGTGNGCSGQIC